MWNAEQKTNAEQSTSKAAAHVGHAEMGYPMTMEASKTWQDREGAGVTMNATYTQTDVVVTAPEMQNTMQNTHSTTKREEFHNCKHMGKRQLRRRW